MSLIESDNKERLFNLKDEELRKIVYIDYADYEDKEVVNFAKKELFKRFKDNIYEDDSLTFNKLLHNVNTEDILTRLYELYPESEQEDGAYRLILKKLCSIEPSECSNTYVSIENLGYQISKGNIGCDIFGVDKDSKERFDVKYCTWREWLSFLIKKRQLQRIGAVDFVVHCLRKMTSVGFDEDVIKRQFDEILIECQQVNNEKNMNNTEVSDCIAIDSLQGDIDNVTCDAHPWIRYFARSIDTLVFFNITQYLLFFVSRQSYNNALTLGGGVPFRIAEYSIWILFEAFLLSNYGYTLGKWILNVEVRKEKNEKLTFNEALKRAIKVFIYGEALSIPYIGLIANFAQYGRLTKNGITSWDEEGKFVVSHSKIEVYKIILAVLILIVYPIAIVTLKRLRIF